MITKKHSTFTFQETIFWDGLSFVTWCASLLKGCPLSAKILGYALVFKWCNVCKENSPHNITTPPAWTADTRQDGLMDSDVTAEIETHQKRRVFFPILYCSMLVSQCKLCPWFTVFRCTGVDPSVVFCSYCLSVVLRVTIGVIVDFLPKQSGQSPLTSVCGKIPVDQQFLK